MNAVAKALTHAPKNGTRSEATKIEQSRAIAEVQAAVIVAQNNPRSVPGALATMREATAQLGLADNAFFKFARAGSTIEGPSIHLATELARCWGNVDYGLKELNRDDDTGASEMYAYAWDLETNARSVTTFIVPHRRDTKLGPVPLRDARDIYENNANHGARRMREMIFRILPKWFVEEAEAKCRETLAKGTSEKPLAQQIADMLAAFEREFGVSRDRIEAKLGTRAEAFTPVDLASLRIAFKSIKQRDVTADEEFPSTVAATVTAALSPSAGTDAPPPRGADVGASNGAPGAGRPSPATPSGADPGGHDEPFRPVRPVGADAPAHPAAASPDLSMYEVKIVNDARGLPNWQDWTNRLTQAIEVQETTDDLDNLFAAPGNAALMAKLMEGTRAKLLHAAAARRAALTGEVAGA